MKKTVAITVIAAMLLAALSGCGCKKESNSETSIIKETETRAEVVTEVATDEQGNTYYTETTEYVADTGENTTINADKVEEDATSHTAADKKETSKTESKTTSNTNSKSTNNKQSSSNTNSNSGASKSTSTPKTDSGNTKQQSSNSNTQKSETSKTSSQTSKQSSQASDPHAGKTWHEVVYKTVNHPAETKKVKVVDQEAYSYEEPVYEWRTFCNVCGADITTTCDDHMYEHAIKGEGGRYHNDYVQVGTKTVTVPEKSHYETVVVKEAWTEKVLVKEAGWY